MIENHMCATPPRISTVICGTCQGLGKVFRCEAGKCPVPDEITCETCPGPEVCPECKGHGDLAVWS